VWAGTDVLGRAVAVAVLPEGVAGEARRRRLAALAGVEHRHLARVLDVVALRGGSAVVSERVPGPTLAAVRAARRPLAAEEAAGVLAAIAPALARLHEHGIVHGDVSPANVVLSPERGPVLVDLVADLAAEAGTAGFVAPECLAGRAAGPAADVWSLATTAMWAVAPADRPALSVALAGALAEDPAQRWDAAALGTAAATVGAPRTVDLPDAAALAQGTVRAAATLAPTTPAGRRRRRRARRATPRRDAAAVLAGLAVALALGFALRPGSPLPGDPGRPPVREAVASATATPAGPEVTGTAARQGVEDAVLALLEARDAALATGDGDALRSLSVPGSPAAEEDGAVVRALVRGDVRLAGLRTVVHAAAVRAHRGREARVEVVTSQSAYERSVGGGAAELVPGAPRACAVLVVQGGAGRWRVGDVEPCGDQRASQAAADSMVG
jgi:hypothetical protein